jgi:hypothetical protein
MVIIFLTCVSAYDKHSLQTSEIIDILISNVEYFERELFSNILQSNRKL